MYGIGAPFLIGFIQRHCIQTGYETIPDFQWISCMMVVCIAYKCQIYFLSTSCSTLFSRFEIKKKEHFSHTDTLFPKKRYNYKE